MPEISSSGSGHHQGAWSKPRECGSVLHTACSSACIPARNQNAARETGIPMRAPSSRVFM
ncbi:hypothetical protein ACIOD1_34750 [Streptomyces sp. NPDC088097]|uniref:hypothetical protein n=1 Tax=Streptomyces sp. NPDC088097 TaxID=3365823 RepID=UPI003814B731